MPTRNIKTDRLTGVFLVGAVLLNFPLVSIFNATWTVFSIPVLYFYIFVVWAVIILFLALLNKFE